jgi:hypothetical protein
MPKSFSVLLHRLHPDPRSRLLAHVLYHLSVMGPGISIRIEVQRSSHGASSEPLTPCRLLYQSRPGLLACLLAAHLCIW